MSHAERKHAVLSPSGSKRWLACTPSALLETLFPDITSTWAEEGTRAHEIAEQTLNGRLNYAGETEYKTEEDKRIKSEVLPYVDHVLDLTDKCRAENEDTVLFIETRLDFEKYVPGGFGVADAIIMSGDTLYLIDLKFGHDPVEAEDNTQLQIYALGAIEEFGQLYDFEKVVMQIYQPRVTLTQPRQQTKTVTELKGWGETVVRPKALEALAGAGAYVPGEHCKYCKAAAVCRARLEKYSAITALQELKPAELADKGELAKVVRAKDEIEKWLKDVAAYALNEMTHGAEFEGLKLVEGRKGLATLKDPDELVKQLKQAGVNETLIYKPAELQTKTELKKLVKKDVWAKIEESCYEPGKPGTPKIDRAESKKKAWKPADDFADVDLSAF